MEANIVFDNVTAYDVDKFDVRMGETFTIELVNVDGQIRWFADNDSALQIIVMEDGDSAKVTATGKGRSEIQLQNNNQIIKTLQVEVYDVVATSLNPVAQPAILK